MKPGVFCTALATTLLALSAMLSASPSRAAQVAASIEYETVPRPAGLPDSFQPELGVSLQFLAIKAIDGFRVDAALWQPSGRQVGGTPLIVMVHGGGDNYHYGPNASLAHDLSAKGYAALAINTRQHDAGIGADNFFDIRRDIDAAVQTARAMGYRSLILQGHSLGNIQVQFYAATNWDPDIKAVILLAPFGNLPWKSRTMQVQNEDSFKALADAAMTKLREGALADVLSMRMRDVMGRGRERPVTAQHFLTYRWERTSVADGTFWVHRIPKPILMVRSQADGAVLPFEPFMLLAAAHEEGSLATSLEYILLPDGRTPSVEGHNFFGNEPALTDAVASWLAKQHL
jgi:pimeloyl-ACP methyl ester carboxylesterase